MLETLTSTVSSLGAGCEVVTTQQLAQGMLFAEASCGGLGMTWNGFQCACAGACAGSDESACVL